MSSGIQVIKDFLTSMEASRSPYSVGKPTRVDSDYKNIGYDKPEKFSQTSLFGFVPVFDKSGAVSIYIRMGGGPEYINKLHRVSPVGTAINDAPEADEMSKFYGGDAATYDSLVDTIDSTDTLIYHPQFGGRERDFLQHNVLSDKSRWTALQIAKLYPFRIEVKDRKLVLSFAKNGLSTYSPISSNDSLLIAFITELLVSAIVSLQNTQNSPSADISAVLEMVWKENNQTDLQSLVSMLFTKLATEFEAAANNNVMTYFDGTLPGKDENAYDHLYYQVFAQVLGFGEDLTTKNVKAIFAKISDVTSSIMEIPSTFNYETVSLNLRSRLSSFVDEASLDLVAKNKVANANKSSSLLKSENKHLLEQNSKLVDPKMYRNVGIFAGLVSSYLAVEQTSAKDMDLWKKALIVAGGAGLGAIPYVNFISIASMPYLVNKGIQLSGDDEFKSRAKRRLVQARDGAGRLASSARAGAGRVATSARGRLGQARTQSAGELPDPSEA
jgi:hypothetical protein